MQEYVCGFAFKKDSVLLIKKTHPEWQAGHWNGIGGKVERIDPAAKYAMAREFQEETGIKTKLQAWQPLVELNSHNWRVHFFKAFDIDIFQARTTTREEVGIFFMNALPIRVISNLRWLIPLAHQQNISMYPADTRLRMWDSDSF
jgi:8-oxo-dGTP diphosphatase